MKDIRKMFFLRHGQRFCSSVTFKKKQKKKTKQKTKYSIPFDDLCKNKGPV